MEKELQPLLLLAEHQTDKGYEKEGKYYFFECFGHKVVAVVLYRTGTNEACSATNDLQHSFPTSKNIVLYGIAGGIPKSENKPNGTNLGDVVASGSNCGVIQWDFTKQHNGTFSPSTQTFKPPSELLLDAFKHWSFNPRSSNFQKYTDILKKHHAYYSPESNHVVANATATADSEAKNASAGATADGAADEAENVAADDGAGVQSRNAGIVSCPNDASIAPTVSAPLPQFLVGTIACGNSVVKDSAVRDKLVEWYPEMVAIEMEGAGVATAVRGKDVEYLIIRSICDFSDATKNKLYQDPAACNAAAAVWCTLENTSSPRKNKLQWLVSCIPCLGSSRCC